MKTIAIIGAGFSGVALAVNLIRLTNNSTPLRIYSIEKSHRLGRGLAYGTWNDNHVLNVPAGNMSLLKDEPDDFLHYCLDIYPAFTSGSYVSRRIYGDYLEDCLLRHINSTHVDIECIHDEVTSVTSAFSQKVVRIEIARCRELVADFVVLALGHLPPVTPHFIKSYLSNPFNTARYIDNPWNFKARENIEYDDRVMIIGTGHTAIDTLFDLTQQNDLRKVYLVSRHGLLPQAHRPHGRSSRLEPLPTLLNLQGAGTRIFLRQIRREIRLAEMDGIDWRDVIAPLRSHTSERLFYIGPMLKAQFWEAIAVPELRIHAYKLAEHLLSR